MSQLRVILYGLGPIGSMVARHLVERGGYTVVGAVDRDPQLVGRDAGAVTGLGTSLGVRVTAEAGDVLGKVDADVVLLATQSRLEQVRPQILECVTHGLHVVSTCEELAYPWTTAPRMAEEIDACAKAHGAAVLATGVNPGFVMDLLPLVLTGVCQRVTKVTVQRIQDAQYRRLPFQKKIGVGLVPSAFDQRRSEGTLRHVGLTESMHMVAARMGWRLDRIVEQIDPVIAEERVVTESVTVEPGHVLGIDQTGSGYAGADEVIRLRLRATIGEPEPRDQVIIEGTPRLDVTVAGGINGDLATAAMVVNAIPVAMRAAPGLRTMADVEPVTFVNVP